MNSTIVALISIACVYGGALLGLALQRPLPNHHLSKESHEIVKLGAGMIATFTVSCPGDEPPAYGRHQSLRRPAP
jgi:hypothetical protein